MDVVAGQNVGVDGASVQVRLQSGSEQIDVVALLLDDTGQVDADADFVFYNAPNHPSGGATLEGQALSLDLPRLPPEVDRVIVAANSPAQAT